jgi:nicotinamidase-related amidase
MQLEGVEPALQEAKKLLEMARDLKIPVIHIQHDAGPGSPYDVRADIGTISVEVAPIDGESVITKQFPNAFIQTELDAQLKGLGAHNIVLAGFMTHMCINSTAHGGFNLGYAPIVVASATATRALPASDGSIVPAAAVHAAALAATRDLYAVVVDDPAALAA